MSILKKEPDPSACEEAARVGDECISICKGWQALAATIRFYWGLIHGSHFEGLFDDVLDDLTPHSHFLHTARKVAQIGVDSKCELSPFPRTHADHHPSAMEKLPEALKNIWKDARAGRIVRFTSQSEPFLA